MNFSLVTIEKARWVSIEFTNPRTYELIQASEMVCSHFAFSEAKYSYANDGDRWPTLVAFLAQARFYVSLYNQHAFRNRTKDKSLSVNISFVHDLQGKGIVIEAFIQNEFLTNAVLLAKHSEQVNFSVEISDETTLANLESKLFDSSEKSDFSITEAPDKFLISFL